MIYLDNAATSFPKPKETIEALNNFVLQHRRKPGQKRSYPVTGGRSNHLRNQRKADRHS